MSIQNLTIQLAKDSRERRQARIKIRSMIANGIALDTIVASGLGVSPNEIQELILQEATRHVAVPVIVADSPPRRHTPFPMPKVLTAEEKAIKWVVEYDTAFDGDLLAIAHNTMAEKVKAVLEGNAKRTTLFADIVDEVHSKTHEDRKTISEALYRIATSQVRDRETKKSSVGK